ncbi:MAG TPA: ATP-binding protein [Thermoanaerobaculia bacterium]
MYRVVVTGSECTGKTTTAATAARLMNVPWVPEAARIYAEAKGSPLALSDVSLIARAHVLAVEEAQWPDPGLVILDTDLISTVVYSRHYYGRCPRWIEREARVRLADLYLLHVPDLPWHPDPSRDRGHLRAEMNALFVATLREYAASVIEIAGSGPARVERAIAAIRAIGVGRR